MGANRVASLACVAALALGASSCVDQSVTATSSSKQSAGADLPAVEPLDWGTCTDEFDPGPDFECATLTVPLDYGDADGATLDLALIRLPASKQRTGAVLLNPGGPGGSGWDFTASAATALRDEMGLEAFDLVGFDPRGVDRSGGIRCLTDEQVDATVYLDSTPDTPAEQEAYDAAPYLEDACRDAYGDDLAFYSTENAARDMDVIRRALGDDTISYLGVSYGTYLGAVYATLFPDRVRALVLDAAFEPSGDDDVEQYTTQAGGFEGAFNDWVTWCQTTPECAFTSADVASAWEELSSQLDDAPAPGDDGRLANEQVFSTATSAALYSRDAWPVLAKALADARSGDGAGLLRLADGYVGRSPDGTYDTQEQSFAVITCASGLGSPAPADPQAVVDELGRVAPRFSEGVTVDDFGDECEGFGISATPPILSYTGDAPVLVIGGLKDPATPLRWAEEMTAAMGANARLLTYTGEGHGFVLTATCVTQLAAAVLVDGTLPDEGETCDPDPEIERPSWWDRLVLPPGIDPTFDAPEVLVALGIGPTQGYSELHLSSLDNDGVIAAYTKALERAGFELADDRELFDGVAQAGFFAPNSDDFLSVIVVSPEAAASPDVGDISPLLSDPTKTLVVVSYFPG
ncbi:MAG: alpha/beta hydrolase [Ilumatobacteraceae bacterium]